MDINKVSVESFEQTIKYQEDFLDFFELDSYDDTIIREKTEHYFNLMSDIDCVTSTARHLAHTHFLSNDIELGFYVFFSEDHFYEFRSILEDYNENKEFDISRLQNFCDNIKK